MKKIIVLILIGFLSFLPIVSASSFNINLGRVVKEKEPTSQNELHLKCVPYANIYVDDDAESDWYDATHVKTIQEGVNNASSDDIVYVFNGTYKENLVIDKLIKLIGENKETTIIDGDYKGDVIKINADGVKIRGFTLQNTDDWTHDGHAGIRIYSSNTTISCNKIRNADNGVLAKCSNNNNISGNSISVLWTNIELTLSDSNIINDNTLGSAGMLGINLDHSYDNIVSNNFIRATSGAGILIRNSENNTIIHNVVGPGCQDGIILIDISKHNIISDNNVSSNYHNGIELYSSHNNICNNIIKSNDEGIALDSTSSNNNIYNNTIISNADKGIDVNVADNNNIYANNITENKYGIYMDFIGLLPSKRDYSCNNKVYHNNFFNNSEGNAYDRGKNNIWNDDYPSCGNYWGDYKGIDTHWGPKQNRLGSDGVGDRSYEVKPHNFLPANRIFDYYPLMKPYNSSFSISQIVHQDSETQNNPQSQPQSQPSAQPSSVTTTQTIIGSITLLSKTLAK